MALVNYRLALKQTWLGSSFVSLFNYFDPNNGTNGDCLALLTHFRDEVLPELNGCQHNGLLNVSLTGINTTSGTDSQALFLTGGGTRAASDIARNAPFLTFSFRWNVSDTQYGPRGNPVKLGYTRIGGVTDNDVTQGMLVSSFMTDFGQNFVNAMLVQKGIGAATYRTCIHAPGNSWKISQIEGCSGVKLGSQNSRKV